MLVPVESATGTNVRGRMCRFLAVKADSAVRPGCSIRTALGSLHLPEIAFYIVYTGLVTGDGYMHGRHTNNIYFASTQKY